MRTLLLKGASSVLAIVFLGAAVATPAAAWQRHVCSKGAWYGWRVTKWPSDANLGYTFGDFRGGIVLRSILSVYPYNEYGYACTGYRPVCDQWGRVIGHSPFLVC
jgi:hypothetical protein